MVIKYWNFWHVQSWSKSWHPSNPLIDSNSWDILLNCPRSDLDKKKPSFSRKLTPNPKSWQKVQKWVQWGVWKYVDCSMLSPPTVIKYNAYYFFQVVRVCGRPLLGIIMFLNTFFLFFFDCNKPITFATSLLLICFFKKAIVSTSFLYETWFVVLHNFSIHARKPQKSQLNTTCRQKIWLKNDLSWNIFSHQCFMQVCSKYWVYKNHLLSCSFFLKS